MYFDDEKKRKKEAEDFDKIVDEMEKIIDDAFKDSIDVDNKGFSLKIDDSPSSSKKRDTLRKNDEIVDTGDKIYITVEIHEKDNKNVKVKLKRSEIVEIKTGSKVKEIALPAKVQRKYKKTMINCVLDIEFTKQRN